MVKIFIETPKDYSYLEHLKSELNKAYPSMEFIFQENENYVGIPHCIGSNSIVDGLDQGRSDHCFGVEDFFLTYSEDPSA